MAIKRDDSCLSRNFGKSLAHDTASVTYLSMEATDLLVPIHSHLITSGNFPYSEESSKLSQSQLNCSLPHPGFLTPNRHINYVQGNFSDRMNIIQL